MTNEENFAISFGTIYLLVLLALFCLKGKKLLRYCCCCDSTNTPTVTPANPPATPTIQNIIIQNRIVEQEDISNASNVIVNMPTCPSKIAWIEVVVVQPDNHLELGKPDIKQ